ncbi:MAG: hypothetical protein ACQCN6_00775 [Candidatus Bathyarchaeia archaeon]
MELLVESTSTSQQPNSDAEHKTPPPNKPHWKKMSKGRHPPFV